MNKLNKSNKSKNFRRILFLLFISLFFAEMKNAVATEKFYYPPILFTDSAQVTLRLRDTKKITSITCDGVAIPFQIVKRRGNGVIVNLPKIPSRESFLRIERTGQSPLLIPIIEKISIALSFDDGPAQGKTSAFADSPTFATLQVLANFRHGRDDAQRGVCAIFFVLTSPDTFLFDTFTKAETEFGARMLQAVADRGHLIGAHWGGGYRKQTSTHPRHAALPATNGYQENLLETELQECLDRVEILTGVRPKYVRPPLWKYRKGDIDARNTYARLGLKMMLTDAKYPDGGYKIISVLEPRKKAIFVRNLRRAFLSGEKQLVISMHDSNSQTAARLPEILQTVKKTFANIDFGVAQPLASERLHFASTPAEVEKILAEKNRFVMFPHLQ